MGKKGVIWDSLLPWIIGIIALFIILGIYLILSGKGNAILDRIASLLRFGR